MNAGAVRKSIRTDDGLVRRNGFVADLGNERRRSGDVLHHDAGFEPFKVTVANVQGRSHFFERRIAGALTQAVHAAFDLARAHLHGRERVGGGHAQVIVAMHGKHRLVDVGNAVEDVGDDAAEFRRKRVTHCIGNVDGRCARVNGGFHHAAKFVDRSAACVFAREFHIIGVVARKLHGSLGHFNDVVKGLAQLIAHVNRARGNESMNAEAFRDSEGFSGRLDILCNATRQAAGDRFFQRCCNLRNTFKVALGRNRKARFQYVYAKLFERQRDLQLLTRRKTLRQRLFTIAKRGVKNNDPIIARHLQNSVY